MSFKISEVCEINSNNISKKDSYGYINYLDTANLTEGIIYEIQKLVVGKDKIPSRAKRKVKPQDIIISTVRPNQKHYGILKDPVENMIVSTGYAVLTSDKEKVCPEYLYRYLTQSEITNYLQAIAENSTSAYPSIKPSVIGDMEIELPKLEEQKAIANILSTLDEKIEINNQINKNLEEMAQAIFKHWFVDFEFPNEEGKPYKSSGGEMVESELGLIPKGWEVKIIGDELETVLGGTPSRKKLDYWNNGNIAWINSGKVNEFRVLEASEFITEMGLKKSAAKMLPKRTTVIAITGATLGQISLLEIDTSANQSVVGIKENNRLKAEYIHPWMKFIIQELINMQTGGAQQHINKDNINKMNILIPHDRILNCYYDMVSPIFDLITKKEFEKVDLSKIRDALLPKLMSGEIRVPLESESDAS